LPGGPLGSRVRLSKVGIEDAGAILIRELESLD
jgi:hypothetical protein